MYKFRLKLQPCLAAMAMLCFVTQPSFSQDKLLAKQLKQTNYLQTVMIIDSADAGLTRWLKKKVTASRVLPLAADFNALKTSGPALISVNQFVTRSGNGSVCLAAPASLPVKNPSNRSYAFAEMIRPLNKENIQAYNRFSVWVYADIPGLYSVFVGCTLYNQGKHVMPTPGRFEGQHFVNIYPNRWQQIIWEIPDLYRDSVTGFSLSMMLGGSPKGGGDSMKLYAEDMRLETVAAENTRGFAVRSNAIAYSHSGYKTGAEKQAFVQSTGENNFQLLNEKGKPVFTAATTKQANGIQQLDFSQFNTPGYYRLHIGDISSKPFAIGADAYLATAWHTLNFFYAERCGYDQPGIHQACHKDATCIHPDGRKIAINGGWHDAADLTQGLGNTARGGMAMLELAQSVKNNAPLYKRLLEEARWGLNWTMETRFGDGYRLGGLIMGIWSDNITGTKDDMQAKATNNPFDNFIAAAYCAMGASFYADDVVFNRWCTNSAIQDYQFAKDSLQAFVTSKNETELYAQATVAAMYLYRLTHQPIYLDDAASFAKVVMSCQQTKRRTDWKIPLHGFFYESHEHKRILEFFHRSNEELMMQGLTMLLKDAPAHADAILWKNSCKAYADYLLDIASSIAPYGLLPAAVYEVNNADFAGIYHEGDQVGMPSMEEYNAQVKNGITLGNGFYLRRFPVAYQFRGFNAIWIGKAKAAFMLADLLKDKKLQDIATRQLEYIVGCNPFAMSTIYGDGYDYPPLYGAYAGDVTGAVPVGIETFENDDEPYMPMQVNATYKEIWTHTTAGVMWLTAMLLRHK